MTTTNPSTDTKSTKPVPIAIWPSAQQTAQQQRRNTYVTESKHHPAKMLPDLARRIIEEFSKPGDLVLDPMAGSGTSLVEAALLGRDSVGVELDQRWTELANANISHTLSEAQQQSTLTIQGDARNLKSILGDLYGKVDLIITSPPYACDIAAIDKPAWLAGGSLKATATQNYSGDKTNLGHARGDAYAEAMLDVYQSCFGALRPGGFLVTATKNMRKHGELIDLAGTTSALAHQCGFTYLQHIVSLLCGVRDSTLVGRPSLWQYRHTIAARDRGLPLHLVAHEDVLVFQANKESAK